MIALVWFQKHLGNCVKKRRSSGTFMIYCFLWHMLLPCQLCLPASIVPSLQALNVNLHGMLDFKSPFVNPLDDLGILFIALRLSKFHVVVHIIPAREQHKDIFLASIWCLFLLMAPAPRKLPR